MMVTIIGFTKHYYIEGQRIVSKIGEPAERQSPREHHINRQPREQFQHIFPTDTVIPAGGDSIDWDLKGQALKEAIYANFEALGLEGAVFTAGKSGKVPYGQLKKYYRNSNLVGGGNSNAQTDTTVSNKFEKFQYFYHPDHLGSSSFITDAGGEVQQHMEYFPFGETFIEEHHGHDRYSNYKFNAKELDEETGLYYYGARYYDPKISMWYGVDLMTEDYPSVSPYAFTANNPIVIIDPNGKDIYGFDENTGQLSLVKKTKDDFDRINVGTFNKDNEFTASTGEDASSIEISKGTLQGEFFDDISKSGLVFSEGKLAEGLKTMEFLSFESNKEFNAWGYESDNGYGLSISPWEGNTFESSQDFYLKSEKVGYLGDKVFKIHTHPGTKDNNSNYGYGKASVRKDIKGKVIGGDAYKVRFNESYPHYIRAAKANGYSKYDKEGKTEYNVGISIPIRKNK